MSHLPCASTVVEIIVRRNMQDLTEDELMKYSFEPQHRELRSQMNLQKEISTVVLENQNVEKLARVQDSELNGQMDIIKIYQDLSKTLQQSMG